MIKRKEDKINACAICDEGTMYGTIKFYQACVNNNIKPIIGLSVEYIYDDIKSKINLYAMNEFGYKNLMKISSRIKLNNGTIFNKDGRERGGNRWNATYLGEATPEIVKEIQEKPFIICVKKQLKEFLKKDLTIEQAQALFQIIKGNEKDEKNNN